MSFRSAGVSAPETLNPVLPADVVFAAWVRPHWPVMHRLARRMAGPDRGDDVLQEALAAAWRKRSQFDESRGTARGWLLAIVADQARKSVRRIAPAIDLRDDMVGAADIGDVSGRLDLDLQLGRLTERQRLAVNLHYYLGLPLADIGEVMDCSTGTVKSTLADARGRLRALLGEDYR